MATGLVQPTSAVLKPLAGFGRAAVVGEQLEVRFGGEFPLAEPLEAKGFAAEVIDRNRRGCSPGDSGSTREDDGSE